MRAHLLHAHAAHCRIVYTTCACVCRHEPWLALDGGEGDGLDAMREVITCAQTLLQPSGFFAVEVRSITLSKLLPGPSWMTFDCLASTCML